MPITNNTCDKHDSMQRFCAISCVKYWRSQLHSSNIKNLKTTSARQGGTKKCYTYGLFGFHKWLLGKQFEYTSSIQVDDDTSHMRRKTVTLEGIDHFLNLYRHNVEKKIDFVVFIKKYLIHLQTTKNAPTIDNAMFAIKSFFRENDLEIDFRFNNSKRHKDPTVENAMTLDDLQEILSIKSIQPIEKAVFMCKFHRGLDSATLADRFNFEAWPQLVEYFGTDNSDMWDVSMCPVPIKLVRVKTNYLHTGFLDTDAIVALQEYLKKRVVANVPARSRQHIVRGSKTTMCPRKRPLVGEALFLDTTGNPISINWIGRRFGKLRKRSGVAKAYPSHEMRDLLKSTLIDSGCRLDIADHVIGHAPKDSYEKQVILYPDNVRTEFAKASGRINVLGLAEPPKDKRDGCMQHDKELVQVDASLLDDLIRTHRRLGEILSQIPMNGADTPSHKHTLQPACGIRMTRGIGTQLKISPLAAQG